MTTLYILLAILIIIVIILMADNLGQSRNISNLHTDIWDLKTNLRQLTARLNDLENN